MIKSRLGAAMVPALLVLGLGSPAWAGGHWLMLGGRGFGGGQASGLATVGYAYTPVTAGGLTVVGPQTGSNLASLSGGSTVFAGGTIYTTSASTLSPAGLTADAATQTAMAYRDFRAGLTPRVGASGAALASVGPAAVNSPAASIIANYPAASSAAGSQAEAVTIANFAAAAGRGGFWGRVFNLFQFFARNNPWFDASPFMPFLEEVFRGLGPDPQEGGVAPKPLGGEQGDLGQLTEEVRALRKEVKRLTVIIRGPELKVGDVIEKVLAAGRVQVKRGAQSFETAGVPGFEDGDRIFAVRDNGGYQVNRKGDPVEIAPPPQDEGTPAEPPTPVTPAPGTPPQGEPGTPPEPGSPGTPAGPRPAATGKQNP